MDFYGTLIKTKTGRRKSQRGEGGCYAGNYQLFYRDAEHGRLALYLFAMYDPGRSVSDHPQPRYSVHQIWLHDEKHAGQDVPEAGGRLRRSHAGAGGDDSIDWANMVFRMYTTYAERKGFTYKVVEMSTDDESGIKNVIFEVMGDYVYGYFKSERGIHRLIRNSPFNAAGARHTSFLSLEVMAVIEEDDSIEIKPEEVKIDTCRSGGAGGQHVNRTDSAVRITHIPTGIVTQCQNERSQIQNREYAMKMLRSKLVERKEIEKFERDSKIRGTLKKIDFGNQIRTYTLSPYTLVKDERLDLKKTNVDDILDGDLDYFVDEFLKRMATPINE